MSKNRPKPMPQNPAPAAPVAKPAKRAPTSKGANTGNSGFIVRLLISGLLAWHLFALFMAPLSLPPTSQIISRFVQGTPEKPSPMQWYLDALYINHGYHFFAPSPGPGHIVRYRVTDDRGETITDGEFPDREKIWPRLRYHRHFMLSDQAELPLPGREPQVAQRVALESYARHLLREHDGSQAQLTRVRHYMLSPEERRQDVKLDAPHKYETQMDVTQRRSDLQLYETKTDSDESLRGAYNVRDESAWRTR